MIVLSIVCMCAFTIVSAGQERVPVKTDLQHQFDRNQDGFIGSEEQALLQEYSEARERIEKLRMEAREAEERAKVMRAEAEEIERSLQRRFRGPQPREALEGMRRHLVELKGAAARADREGRGDQADELRQQAKRIAGEMELRRETPRRQPDDRADQIERQIAELREGAERADQEGRMDEADRLRRQARNLASEAGELGRRRKDRAMKEQIDRLYATAADAKAAGQYDRADAIYREAKEMQRNLNNAGMPKMENEQRNRLEQQVEQLRDQVNGLRNEIEELKEVVRNRAVER